MTDGQPRLPPAGEIWSCAICHKAVCGEGHCGISPAALCSCAYPQPRKPQSVSQSGLSQTTGWPTLGETGLRCDRCGEVYPADTRILGRWSPTRFLIACQCSPRDWAMIGDQP